MEGKVIAKIGKDQEESMQGEEAKKARPEPNPFEQELKNAIQYLIELKAALIEPKDYDFYKLVLKQDVLENCDHELYQTIIDKSVRIPYGVIEGKNASGNIIPVPNP